MAHFPDPIALPEKVQEVRTKRQKQIVQSTIYGISIRFAIIVVELAGVYLFASYALLMDAIASIFDIASSFFLIVCIKLAAKPPDTNHPFGHGRYEPLIGLVLGLMLTMIGIVMFVQQSLQLTVSHVLRDSISPKAWLIPAAAMLLLEICYRTVIRTAQKENSPALAADAIHYRMDALTSLFAMIALLFAAYFPAWSVLFDHCGAIVIALFMIGLGIYAAKNNFHQLMDRTPDQKFFEIVRKAALSVEGVQDTEKIRIQLYGPDAHVDIDIEVDPQLSVKIAHEISQLVRVEIQKAWPVVRDVTVHLEPFYPNDH
jgi:cation diffusion facilitator family transporter